MELKVPTNKNKLLNLALILLTLIIAYNTIYKRQVKEEQLLKQKINEETKKNEVLKSIGKTEKTISAYNNLLPKKDANLIINIMGSLAKRAGIEITSIRPGQEQRNPDYIKIPFNLTFRASNYHAIGAFISDIENSSDVYIVEAVNINSQTETKGLNVNLTVSSIALAN